MAEEAYRTGLTDELTFAATVGRPAPAPLSALSDIEVSGCW